MDDILKHMKALHIASDPDHGRALSKKEAKTAYIYYGLQGQIGDLLMKGINMKSLELVLFWHWLRQTALVRGHEEDQANAWFDQTSEIMLTIQRGLNQLVEEADDEGASEELAELGSHIDHMRQMLHKKMNAQPDQATLARDTPIAMKQIAVFINSCFDQDIHPVIIDNNLRYYWLRTSIMGSLAPEEYFQTIERNWDDAVKLIDFIIDDLPVQKPMS